MRADRAVLFRLATNERLERMVKGLPGGEVNAWRAASRYVAGRTRDEALTTTDELLAKGHAVSVDLFGELVGDLAAAAKVIEDYLALAAALPAPPADVWLSVDLSHLALDADPRGAADLLASLVSALPPGRRVQVGAEDAARTDGVLRCVLDVAGRGLADRLGATVQANLKRSPHDVDTLMAAGVHVRLVKGAYLEPRRPTSLTCNWLIVWPQQSRRGRLPPMTGGSGKRSCSRSDRFRSSSCSELGLRCSTSCRSVAYRPASTSPTALTGSATGCAAWPKSRGA